jgi:dihydroflavonol-4-reductase
MKILITGATGLFGRYLVEKFSGIGELHALIRKSSNISILDQYEGNVHIHEGDLSDSISLEEALNGIDLVIHAAGMVSFESKDKEKLMEVNVKGTENLVNSMLETGVKNLLHVSSVAALGRSPDLKVINEDHKWTESEWNTPYAISKHLSDLEVWRGVQEGLQAIVVYPSVLLGKINDIRSSTQIYNYVLEENKYYPKGTINYIDVRDAAAIMRYLFEKNHWNQGFILNQESRSYQSFFSEMANAFGKTAPSKEVKNWMLEFALFFTGVGNKLGFSKSPLNRQTAMLSQLDIFMDNSKVKDLLDFKYTPLAETLNWAKSNEIV